MIFNYFKQLRYFFWILFAAFATLLCAVSEVHASEQAVYDAYGKRDPFAPIISSGAHESAGLIGIESADDIQVEGIIYDPQSGSMVMVNGTVMKEQEESGGIKVVQIKPDGVMFSVNGTQVLKVMHQEDSQ